MKSLWTTLSLVLVTSMLWGQVKIEGRIKQPTTTTATLQLYPTALGKDGVILNAKINSNGQFQFEINSSVAIPCLLSISTYEVLLFIFPDKSLELDIDLNQTTDNRITFAGTAGIDNQLYLQYQNFIKLKNKASDSAFFKHYQPTLYKKHQTALKIEQEIYLSKLTSKLDTRLAAWLENDIQYEYATNLLAYPDRNLISRRPSKKYYRFLDEMRYNNEKAILQVSYQKFLIGYTNYQMFKSKKWSGFGSLEEQLALVRRYFIGNALEYIHCFILKTHLKYSPLEEVDPMYRVFLDSNAAPSLKMELRKAHQIASANALGHVFPMAWLWDKYQQVPSYNGAGKGFPILDKGIILYFWKSQQEKEFLTKIKQLAEIINQNEKLAFVLVGTQEDFTEWKKEIRTIPLKTKEAYHYWIYSNHLKKATKRFQITKFPSLLFLNDSNQVMAKVDRAFEKTTMDWLIQFAAKNFSNTLEEPLSFLYYQPFSLTNS